MGGGEGSRGWQGRGREGTKGGREVVRKGKMEGERRRMKIELVFTQPTLT